MTNQIDKLARQRASEFRTGFAELSRELFTEKESGSLFHPGEFGTYRERLLKRLLLSFLPSHFACAEGFIVNSQGGRSTQCDVVIYDEGETPKLETSDLRRFFPAETVYGAGQVKSVVRQSDLATHLATLMKVKALRNEMPPIGVPVKPTHRVLQTYSELPQKVTPDQNARALRDLYKPADKPWQAIVTFLICESIEFNSGASLQTIADKLYEPGSPLAMSNRHNALLSLKDGYLSYSRHINDRNIARPYPHEDGRANGIRFVAPNEGNDHVLAFLADLADALGNAAVYPFTIVGYMNLEEFQSQVLPMGR